MLAIIRLYLKGFRPRWVRSESTQGVRFIQCIGTGADTQIIAIYRSK